MILRNHTFALVFVFSAALTLRCFAQEPLSLGNRCDIAIDSAGLWSVETVHDTAFGLWSPSKVMVPNFGFSRCTYWFRLRLGVQSTSLSQNEHLSGKKWLPRLLEVGFAALDTVSIFTLQRTGKWLSRSAGDVLPFAEREVNARTVVFPLDIPVDSTVVVYLRIRSETSVQAPLALYTWSSFQDETQKSQLWFGVLYGSIVIMALYNLFLFVGLRDTAYLFYALFMISSVGMYASINGHTSQYGAEYFPSMVNRIIPIFIAFTIAFASHFARVFLRTESEPLLHRILWGIEVLGFACLVLPFVVPIRVAISIIGFFITIPALILFLIISLIIAFRGYKPAWFFVGAWSIWLGGTILRSVENFGFVAKTFITTYLFEIGAIVDAAVFAFALAYRINLLRKEKLEAQQTALQVQQAANEHLETKVQERTMEIKHQVEILNEQAQQIERANATLQEQNSKLELLNYETNELIGIVSHDLKNPIGAIRGLTELLHNEIIEQEQKPATFRQIISTADRMLDLVNNLLEVNRLESGGIQFTIGVYDIEPIVLGGMEAYRQAASEKEVQFHYQNSTQNSLIAADKQATMQIFDNILSNAVKYSPFGKNIFVRVCTQNHLVRIEIQDEGEGISPEDMKKLFGKFARLSAQPTGGEHSTGLGLSIVKKMVEAMNGRVWCESEFGKGGVCKKFCVNAKKSLVIVRETGCGVG